MVKVCLVAAWVATALGPGEAIVGLVVAEEDLAAVDGLAEAVDVWAEAALEGGDEIVGKCIMQINQFLDRIIVVKGLCI